MGGHVQCFVVNAYNMIPRATVRCTQNVAFVAVVVLSACADTTRRSEPCRRTELRPQHNNAADYSDLLAACVFVLD